MKRILPFFFLVLFSVSLIGQGCLSQGIEFKTQAEIDNFAIDYPGCTEILGPVTIDPDNTNITNFNGLNHIVAIRSNLQIRYLKELGTFEGFENLYTVSGFFEFQFNDHVIDFGTNAFSSLVSVGDFLISDNPSLKKINAFSNLEISGYSITIAFNPELISILGISNMDTEFLPVLVILANSKLSVCHYESICNALNSLQNPLARQIKENAPGCYSIDEVLDHCYDSKVRFGTFYDLNQDGQLQPTEHSLLNFPVILQPGGLHFLPNNNSLQTYYLLYGNYELNHIPLPNWTLTTPEAIPFSLDSNINCDTILFGIYPTDKISKMISYISMPVDRCNTLVPVNVSTVNSGTTITSGILWFEIDPTITNIQFNEIPDFSEPGNKFGWKFENLYPNSELKKHIEFLLPGPPQITLGEKITLRAYTEFNDDNGNQTSPIVKNEFEIRCSYDPNDKLINPARTGNYTLFDEDLTYTIRFQNTGNDYAYDVVIRDTLDENLDPTSIKILSSSHYELLNTTIENDRFISFEFKNIFLPDSTTNFDGSQGYISYLIRAKDGLAENTPINNTASIYFDFNPPIVTNTTESIMVSELPTSFVENIDNQLVISVFPNPTKGDIFIKGDNLKNAKITLTDLAGRILKQEKLNGRQEIYLPKTAKGMFFLKVETEEGIAVKRMIKI